MNWNTEKLQTKMVRDLLERLPGLLEAAQAEPVSYMALDDEGIIREAADQIEMPMLAEIWTQQQPTLNFPALILHYQDDNVTEYADCGDLQHQAIWFADIIVTHPNAEILSVLWFRYVEAIRNCLSSMEISPEVLITGPRITENGPLESLFLSRGFLTVQITYI